MVIPEPWEWFHLGCLTITFICIATLYKNRNKNGEAQLKSVLCTYGVIALLLEIIKQFVWSINYNFATNIATWDYQWYAAPFQLCTTPIYACLISACLKKDHPLRKSLLSYVAFVTISGSIATILIPNNCFTSTLVVNIHTMWLHYGSFVVSIYLIMSGEVELIGDNLRRAIVVFAVFVGIATILNVGVYNSGILNSEVFNMFYISPYFISELPVFDAIQKSVPYGVFLMIYIVVLSIGAALILGIAKGIRFMFSSEHDSVFRKSLHAKN